MQQANKPATARGFDLQGHRGCRGLMPENTIPAMYRAIDLGVTTLEMDVVITADGKVVLSHEPFMSAEISTSPEGRVVSHTDEKNFNIYRMTYAEVNRWDVGLKPHPRFPRQQKMPVRKPLLEDLIDSVEGYIRKKNLPPVYYNIETKCQPSTDNIYHPDPEHFTRQLMEVIEKKKIGNRVIIQSFDMRTLLVVHNRYHAIKTALLVEGFEKKPADSLLAALGFTPAIYSPEYHLVQEGLVTYCREKKMLLVPWTVNDTLAMERLVSLGVDGLITDYPDLFKRTTR
jgi:glycerophosphoryl diester phosphodiesterase